MWVVTKEPTETEEGEETRTCNHNPSHTETRSIPKKDAQNPVYRVVSGDGSSWTRGSTDGLVATYKRSFDDDTTFSHFKGILVDGKEVDKDNYDAVSGSVVVTLEPSYLQTLSTGDHTLEAQFDDGDAAKASFSVKDKTAAGSSGSNNTNTTTNPTTGSAYTSGTSRTATATTGDPLPTTAPMLLGTVPHLGSILPNKLPILSAPKTLPIESEVSGSHLGPKCPKL